MDRKNKATFSDEEIGEMLRNPTRNNDPLRNVSAEDRVKYSTEGYFNWLAYETGCDPNAPKVEEDDKIFFSISIGLWIVFGVLLIIAIVAVIHSGVLQSSAGVKP